MIAELDNLKTSDVMKKSLNFAPLTSSRKPLNTVSLDFETAYTATYSVKSMGVWAYVHDPRFKATQIAAYNDTFTSSTIPAKFDWQMIDGAVIVAHNATFDKAVFDRLQELGQIPPDVQPARWLCTASMSRFLNGPSSLADCAKAWLNEEVDKSIRDRMADGPDLYDDIATYALNDARLCWELWKLLSKAWPEHERAIYETTRRMGSRGVHVDQSYIARCCATLETTVKEASAKIPWVAEGRPALSAKAFESWCARHEIPAPASTAKNDTSIDKWKAKHANTKAPAWLASMQALRRANRTLKVFQAMQNRTMPDGRMAYELLYCGASTGRWSGAGGVNMQNFNRDEVAKGIDLRSAITAAPGNALVVIDYAQIESRVLLWLAGDHATLDVLRTGIDIYEAHARTTMGYKDARPLKDVDKMMRQLAKARVLGLGYGCGPEKFITVAKIMGGLDITFQDSTRMVNDYRRANPLITALWSRLEAAFEKAHGKTYRLPLPSGRKLRYYNVNGGLMVAESVKGKPEDWYGGKLCENFVSATARDILADAWTKIEKAGMNVVLTVHDEIIVESASSQAEAVKRDMEEIMLRGPVWAEGLPLAVEGHIMERYAK
jgi:DNA polymerase